MTTLIESLDSWIMYRKELKAQEKTIGFVPTMGALHEGHLALIRNARRDTDCVLVSIFVNPTQFNDLRDLERYPKTLDKDRRLAEEAGADVVFVPSKESLYPDDYRYRVCESDFSNSLEGALRPGHFNGVLTIVLKLFNLVRPDRAYFGEKDYQQLKLVKDMVKAFFLDVEIVACKTVRELDGLAMSSRNLLLSDEGRKRAPAFHRCLSETPTPAEAREQLIAQGFEVEYIEDRGERRLGAVVIDNVRLIDNVSLKNSI